MTHREVWKVIVFGLITLGIYDLVWLYRTRKELVAKGNNIPKFVFLIVPFLIMVGVGVLGIIVLSLTANTSADTVSSPTSAVSAIMMVIVILAALASIPIYLWWFYHYCKAVEKVTGGKTTFGLAFGLAIILNIVNVGFVWPGVIQDAYNKIADGATAGGPQPNTAPEPPYPPVQPAATPPSQPAV